VALTLRSRSISGHRRIAILPLRLLVAQAAVLAISGCQTVMVPLPAGSDVQIAPGQGLLIVETDSNSDIETLRLAESPYGDGRRILKNIPSGHRVHLVALPEGNYRWVRIELPGLTFRNRSYPVRWQLERAEQWQVTIKAGQVSYPGMIVLHRSAWSYLSYRVINRSGKLLQFIEESFPDLLAQHAIRYGGAGRDDFLEYYQETLRSRSFTNTAPDEEVPIEPGDF